MMHDFKYRIYHDDIYVRLIDIELSLRAEKVDVAVDIADGLKELREQVKSERKEK